MENTSEPKTYEITFFIGDENVSSVVALLKKHGAQIMEEKPLQKTVPAYAIKKQTQCFIGVIRFSAMPSTVENMRNDLNLEHTVYRFMIHTVPQKKASVVIQSEATFSLSSQERPKSATVEKKGPRRFFEKILTNEALEKKIEEMLQ